MKVMVTGAGGQLGSDLGWRLTGAGFDVALFEKRALDITEREVVESAVKTFAPELIINCAAYTKVDHAEDHSELAKEINVRGSENIALVAAASGIPVVHISTDFVFDGEKRSPYVESDPTSPLGVYGATKLEGEVAILESGCDSMIVRTSWLYGSGGPNFVKTMLRLAKERDEIWVVSDQIGSPTWTGDLAGALVRAAEMARGGVFPKGLFHYAGSGEASWYDLALAAIEGARSLGEEFVCKEVVAITTDQYPTAAKRPPYSVLDTALIRETLNVTIPPWRESLEKMLKELYGENNNA